MKSIELGLIEEFGTATFSERNPEHKSLGWSGGVEDERDWRTEDFLGIDRDSGRQLWANPIRLDQGAEGACVGAGHTGVSNAQPAKSEFGNARIFEVYNLAKTLDAWPGSNYEGTSVRAGAKAQVSLGEYEGYAFTQDVYVLALWILNHGTAAIGVDWLTGMDRVDSEGFIHASGSERGGHCVNVDGVTWDWEDNPFGINYFRFPNSWSKSWGFNGRGRISADDLQYLFNRGGTACMPVEIPNV